MDGGRQDFWKAQGRLVPESVEPAPEQRVADPAKEKRIGFQIPGNEPLEPFDQERAMTARRHPVSVGGRFLPPLERALELRGPSCFADTPLSNENIGLLRQIGLPVDLLRFFPVTSQSESTPYGIVSHTAKLLVPGADVEAVASELRKVHFEFSEIRPR